MDDERERLVAVMALIDKADSILAMSMDGMSTGPVHEDIANLRENLTERGRDYKAIPKGMRQGELRHEASKLDISIERVEE